MKSSPLTRLLAWLLLVVGLVVFAAPLVWMIATTLKLDHELVRRPVRWLPDLPTPPTRGAWTDPEGRTHTLALGRVIAVTPAGEEIALEPTDGQIHWGHEPLGDESNRALRTWRYDFSSVDENPATIEGRLPDEVDAVDHWIVEISNDRSFHRLRVEIADRDGARQSGMHIIGNDEHQDLVCRAAGDTAAERGDLTLTPLSDDVGVTSDVRVTVTLQHSSRSRATWLKFTEQYRRALVYLDFWSFTRNSIYLVVLSCLGAVLASSLVAFSFARLRWHGRNVLFLLLLATMMLPPQVTMVPQFLIWRGLGFYDTLVPLWLPTFFAIPFFVFLLRQFMLSIPQDLEDAARIDGCSALGIWARVILPLIKPALIAVAIFQFLFTWNDFMGPLIYVANPALQPLSVGVYIFNQAFSGQWGLILAAATMMLIPVLAMFFAAQRYFIEGVTLTGLKA